MSFESLLIHTVVIYNRPNLPVMTEPRYGDEIEVWDNGTATPGRVDLQQSQESTIDRETRTTTATLFLPATITISALSYWMWGTRKFRVDGEPKMLYDGAGPHHWEVSSVEVRG